MILPHRAIARYYMHGKKSFGGLNLSGYSFRGW